MKLDHSQQIVALRLAVGLLGEQEQSTWAIRLPRAAYAGLPKSDLRQQDKDGAVSWGHRSGLPRPR
jgi:hypothetical protein